ncbi:MAG: DUF2281 domain-containing protein [Acidobacteria bacterium]|nr:DUF2281 domain-containing protein [Acidobacteriota bacterium]
MANLHTTNKLDDIKGGVMRAGNGSPVERNKSSIFSSTRGVRPTRNPIAQRRVADLNKGEIWASDDFDEPLPDEFWTGME